MKKHYFKIALGTGLLMLGISLLAYYTLYHSVNPAWSPGIQWNKKMESDHIDGQVYKINDTDNTLISKMSRIVMVGDEVITSKGRRYKVNEVNGYNAKAEFKGMDREMLGFIDEFENMTIPVLGKKDPKENKPIAIYHTHSAESYVPTDGTESEPYHGGIYQVGEAFASSLEKKGVEVLYNKNPHEPRDENAYYRSRRTAVDLMKKNPVALIDIHRDGIPDPNYYTKKVSGEDVTQVRLVVGKQNPKMQSNMEFAKKVMAYANKAHPGIVKEIFIAHGNYNQDLMSSAMLFEVGTHTNPKGAAEKGATLLAGTLPGLLDVGGVSSGGGYTDSTSGSQAGWKTLAWIIGIAILGGGAFLLVSSGSMKNARKRLSSYWGREFAGFMAPSRKRTNHKRNTKQGDVDKSPSEEANEAFKKNRDKV